MGRIEWEEEAVRQLKKRTIYLMWTLDLDKEERSTEGDI